MKIFNLKNFLIKISNQINTRARSIKFKGIKKMLKNNFKETAPVLIFVVAIIIFATLFAELTYRPQQIIKRGFAVIFDDSGKLAPKKPEPVVDFASLFATADAIRGAKIFKKCSSCHSINKGEGAKVGPNLYGVIGRNKGSTEGFNYSEALKGKGGLWSKEEVNQFITKPKEYIKGTKMAFAGLKKPQDRADVILYLQQNAK